MSSKRRRTHRICRRTSALRPLRYRLPRPNCRENLRLRLADDCIDVILSNCVINLSPDKAAVFADAFRLRKPGGRVCISDIVALAPMPENIVSDEQMISGCVGGAAEVDEIVAWLEETGFHDVCIEVNENSRQLIDGWGVGPETRCLVASETIESRKPEAKTD